MIARIAIPAAVFNFILLSTTFAAGQPSVPFGPGSGQGPQIIQGTAPPRDQRSTAPGGTAVIRGRVVAADTGRALRRARIRLTAPELGPEGRTTSTSTDGRYEIRDLPAGRYTLQVMRNGYLTLNYGQRRPLEQGKPLQVADKQVVENVDFALPKTSVITGRITDELGEAVAGAQVFAMRSTYWQGRRRLVPAGVGAPSDDAGQYRITNLAPGTYYVMAMLRDMWTVSESGVETVMGYAPTYYPGSAGPTNARRVSVGVGQEAATTDFSLIPGRSANISGLVVDSHGRPLAGRTVGLMQEIAGPNTAMMLIAGNAAVSSDGSFSMKNVPPGEYKLRVQTTTEGAGPAVQVQEAAVLPVVIDGLELNNVLLSTSAGWSASGQVTAESGTLPAAVRERIRLAGLSQDGDGVPNGPRGLPGMQSAQDNGRVKDDGSFAVSGIFGAARLRATVPDGWAVKAILHDGTDISDTPMELKSGEELTDVQVIVTDRVTTLSGQLTDDKGGPVTDGTVIVFAEDSAKWAEDSRWVRAARPDQKGQYQIKGLPAGRYSAIAVDYVEDGMWNDPEYLTSIQNQAQKVTLLDAATQALSLKVGTP